MFLVKGAVKGIILCLIYSYSFEKRMIENMMNKFQVPYDTTNYSPKIALVMNLNEHIYWHIGRKQRGRLREKSETSPYLLVGT